MKNRNLLIELNLPQENHSKQKLINSWTKPTPKEYHLINSPTLTHSIADFIQNEHSSHCFNPQELPEKTPSRGRNKERKKYRKLEQELKFLQQFLQDLKELHESDLLMYRQTVLVRYLNNFVEQIKTECQEKGHFIRSIWNALIRIFQQLFERIVSESKKKEKRMLTQEIKMHNDYQLKLEELSTKNENLLITEQKYQNSIKKLSDNVASLNIELKGTKHLQQKSATALRELTHKYEELKADYLDIIMQAGMSRIQAQTLLNDKQLLLFSKQVVHKEAEVKLKPKNIDKRKAQIIDSDLDVELLLQQIDAEEEYQFEINCSDRQVNFVNKKVQTIKFSSDYKDDKEIQCGYYEQYDEDVIRNRGIQTAKVDFMDLTNIKIQTDKVEIVEEKTEIEKKLTKTLMYFVDRTFEYSIQPERREVKDEQQPKLATNTQLQDENKKFSSHHSKRQSKNESRNSKQISRQTSKQSIMNQDQLVSMIERQSSQRRSSRDSKLFRVSQANRSSHRLSKMYKQKTMKTEGSRDSIYSSKAAKKRNSSTKKVSGFLLLDQLKKTMTKKSKFQRNSEEDNLFTKIKQEIPFVLNENILSSMLQIDEQIGKVDKNIAKNQQLWKENEYIYEKIEATMANKKSTISGRCLRIVADILKNFSQYVLEGSKIFNIVDFSIDYIAAVKGQELEKHEKERLFCQFMKACSSLLISSYLVRNFFLLCGFPIKKSNIKTAKVLIKTKQEELYDDNLNQYMYNSEVFAYFQLLSKANCDTSQDILHAYTNRQTVLETLNSLTSLYGLSTPLIQQSKAGIMQAIQASNQNDPKLDIFKCLQLILEKILQAKIKIAFQIRPLVSFYGEPDHKFFIEVLSIWTKNPQKILLTLLTHRNMYVEDKTPEALSTLAIIQGFSFQIAPFIEIQKTYKFNILKKLLCLSNIQNRMLQSIVQAIPRKEVKKPQFLVLLHLLWSYQSAELQKQILGEDLTNLNIIATGYNLTKPKRASFHSQLFDV